MRDTVDLLASLTAAEALAAGRRCWRHRKSRGVYEITGFAIREADLVPLVIYRDERSSITWARPAAEFFDGRFVPLVQDHG